MTRRLRRGAEASSVVDVGNPASELPQCTPPHPNRTWSARILAGVCRCSQEVVILLHLQSVCYDNLR